MKKLIFFTLSVSHPRIIKRIKSLNSLDTVKEAYGFNLIAYKNDINIADIKINHFTLSSSKVKLINHYYRWKYVNDIIKSSKKDDIFYLFGIYMAILFMLSFKKRKYIYEEADIDYASKNKLIFYCFFYFEKVIRRNSILTIFTSNGFANYFYDYKIPHNIYIHPNKLSPYIKTFRRQCTLIKSTEKIKFGFVGFIRFKTIFNFANVIGEFFPQHEFIYWGNGAQNETVQYQIKTFNNVYYKGEFQNPFDLEKVYNSIDVLIVCYDTENFNTHYAEPNKLYEGIYFCKPLVVSTGTYLGETVKKLGVGYAINALDKEEIKKFVGSINMDELNRIIKKEGQYSSEYLFDNPDRLLKKIENVLK